MVLINLLIDKLITTNFLALIRLLCVRTNYYV